MLSFKLGRTKTFYDDLVRRQFIQVGILVAIYTMYDLLHLLQVLHSLK